MGAARTAPKLNSRTQPEGWSHHWIVAAELNRQKKPQLIAASRALVRLHLKFLRAAEARVNPCMCFPFARFPLAAEPGF
jgi:hypothetical protein